MANEFKHKDPGTALTQAEFIASDGTGHIFDCQATGDILYASSATVLKNLGKGAANTILSMGGSCIPAWTASPSVTDLTIGGGCITLSAATDIDLLDNNASALSFDSTGKTGIIDIVTTDCSEGVTMSGTLGVTGILTANAGITLSGALDANGTVDADVTDFDVLSSGDIDLVSSANAAAAVYIAQSTGTSGTIKIHADTGTSVTEGAESINILSDAGGVGIRSTANLANAINITSDGGTTGSIAIFNDQGTSVTEGAESISLLSDAGGVGIRSTANLANAVNITADGGTTSTIQIFNDQGTAATEGAASIQLLSDVGGIGVKSGLNAAGAIRLTADAGTSETIILHADQGSGADSICLTSDAGGITLNPGTFVSVGGIADGEIRLFEDTGAGCNYAAIKVQDMAASYTLTLPADDGCCGEALTTNGSGTLDWTAISSVAAASSAEVVTGSATDVYVSPGRQHFHSSAAKGWVTDNTNSCSANASYNVSGVASGATGIQTVSWDADFPGGCTYAVAGTSFDPPSVPHNAITCPAAGTVIVHQRNNSHALADSVYGIVAYGPLA